ncbi:type I-F CRISPR-associated endoribonuclease Cas6/Csy4 [uncultured Psychrobacter sp.]|uniref:type I-F CRISPR-associated endoribonuclease Cas6/Csy4 n=1 Tax=uncultured Psychrobacter sp. TaxID=259303 RepID=UPI0026223273|nr:type I-F CRISPR-associated endoribonuclease Cas6/Csy4 [uncultured Psychrobacter sp.]
MSQLTHFQEITIIPDPEIAPYFIWSKLFNQLHIALADIKNEHGIDSIGVSFPDYHYDSKKEQSSKLGLKLRVFASSQKDLETLNLAKWLERLTDYMHIKGIKEVGDKATGYVSVHRYRFKPVDVQAESLAKKLGVSYEEAMVTVTKRTPEKRLPYVQMRSQTNQSNYRLRVLQLPCDTQKAGSFNTYGMNGMEDHVTVPHWTDKQ